MLKAIKVIDYKERQNAMTSPADPPDTEESPMDVTTVEEEQETRNTPVEEVAHSTASTPAPIEEEEIFVRPKTTTNPRTSNGRITKRRRVAAIPNRPLSL